MQKRYRLFYDAIELREVVQEDADFPNLWGTFRANGALEDSSQVRHIQAYIAYSVAADHVFQNDGEAEWERFIQANEIQYVDLIESDLWYLLEGEKREAILIPNFCQYGQIVWRWNFNSESQE